MRLTKEIKEKLAAKGFLITPRGKVKGVTTYSVSGRLMAYTARQLVDLANTNVTRLDREIIL